MIEALRSWFRQNSSLLEGEGISGSLSPGSVGLLKNGISAELKTDHLEATIELWETGESDFHFLDWEAAERDPEVSVVVTHYDFRSEQEMYAALNNLVNRINGNDNSPVPLRKWTPEGHMETRQIKRPFDAGVPVPNTKGKSR